MAVLRYRPPAAPGGDPFWLVTDEDTPGERRFVFYQRIEIGRLVTEESEPEGVLLIGDPTVSARHCVITRAEDGSCTIRDTSRNGTRLDGRRLMPNREEEIRPGQQVSVGSGSTFRFVAPEGAGPPVRAPQRLGTVATPSTGIVSVVVGDIRSYTSLVQQVPAAELQGAMARVFAQLRRAVLELGGQVKEYQGDSLLAFWESVGGRPPAPAACGAALELHRLAGELALDPRVWGLAGCPLQMDWAVATGSVTVVALGEERPEELSMVGRPVVLAYRLEKVAGDRTASIVVCERTHGAAGHAFEFRDLGALDVDGFTDGVRGYALVGRRKDPGALQPEGESS